MGPISVIIFNGEKDHEIEKSFFFQDPQIKDLSPTEIVEIYHSTSVYYDVLKDIGHLILEGVVKHVNDTKVDEDYIRKVEEGLCFLELMITDMFGEDSAKAIFKQAEEVIKEGRKPQ